MKMADIRINLKVNKLSDEYLAELQQAISDVKKAKANSTKRIIDQRSFVPTAQTTQQTGLSTGGGIDFRLINEGARKPKCPDKEACKECSGKNCMTHMPWE